MKYGKPPTATSFMGTGAMGEINEPLADLRHKAQKASDEFTKLGLTLAEAQIAEMLNKPDHPPGWSFNPNVIGNAGDS